MPSFLPYLEVFILGSFAIITLLHFVSKREERKSIGYTLLALTGHSAFLSISANSLLLKAHWFIPFDMALGFLFALSLLHHVYVIIGKDKAEMPARLYIIAGTGIAVVLILHVALWLVYPAFTDYVSNVQRAVDLPLLYLGQLLLLQLFIVYCIYMIHRETMDYRRLLKEFQGEYDQTMSNYLKWFSFFLISGMSVAVLFNLLVPSFWSHYLLIPTAYYLFYVSVFALLHRISTDTLDANRNLIRDIRTVNQQLGNLPIVSKAAQMTVLVQQRFAAPKLFIKPGLTVGEAARHIGIARSEFSRYLKAEVKLNFNEFVNKHRIEEAKRLMRSTDKSHLTLEAIGLESGFTSRSSFYRAFKKHHGGTPSEYLQAQRSADV